MALPRFGSPRGSIPKRASASARKLTLTLTLTFAIGGCAHTEHLAMSHRHSPGSEARVVVLPVETPADAVLPEGTGRTLASLYMTELLKSYVMLELERFEKVLEERKLTVSQVLSGGLDAESLDELDVDGVLLSRVYEWNPGRAGFWFLAKKGRIGFEARLVDLRTGGVLWGVNRVVESPGGEPLSVGMGRIFADLALAMPKGLTPY